MLVDTFALDPPAAQQVVVVLFNNTSTVGQVSGSDPGLPDSDDIAAEFFGEDPIQPGLANGSVRSTVASYFENQSRGRLILEGRHNLDVVVDELPFSGLDDRTHVITGTGTLVGRDSDVADSVYDYTGDAVLDGEQLTFAIDQRVDNVWGVGDIFTTGTFDLTSGTGTQTVIDCLGPALLCSDVVIGSTAFYEVQGLEAGDADAIGWQVDVVLDLGGTFGTADSSSTFLATRIG